MTTERAIPEALAAALSRAVNGKAKRPTHPHGPIATFKPAPAPEVEPAPAPEVEPDPKAKPIKVHTYTPDLEAVRCPHAVPAGTHKRGARQIVLACECEAGKTGEDPTKRTRRTFAAGSDEGGNGWDDIAKTAEGR